jgi:hypothetical protein
MPGIPRYFALASADGYFGFLISDIFGIAAIDDSRMRIGVGKDCLLTAIPIRQQLPTVSPRPLLTLCRISSRHCGPFAKTPNR